MIGATAADHRVFLQCAQPWRRFRVSMSLALVPLMGVHPARGLGGDAREMLHDVECGALDRKQLRALPLTFSSVVLARRARRPWQ